MNNQSSDLEPSNLAPAADQHTLKLKGEDLGQQIQRLRFYCPRDAVGPETQKKPAGIAR